MKSYHCMLLQTLIYTHNLHCFKTRQKVSMLKCVISLDVKIFSLMPVKSAVTTKLLGKKSAQPMVRGQRRDGLFFEQWSMGSVQETCLETLSMQFH